MNAVNPGDPNAPRFNAGSGFTQSGVPGQYYDDIKQGWRDFYWAPMKKMLER